MQNGLLDARASSTLQTQSPKLNLRPQQVYLDPQERLFGTKGVPGSGPCETLPKSTKISFFFVGPA